MDNILALNSHEEDYSIGDASDYFPTPNDKCFYGIAGEFSKKVCEKSEADPIAVLLTVLTWSGTYFGGDAYLKLGDLKQPPRLNAVLVGKSAKARKGTSVAPVRALMSQLNSELIKKNIALPQYSDGPMSTGEGLANQVRDQSSDSDNKNIQSDLDKRLMLIEQEFGGVLRTLKREGNSLSAAIRSFWDNGSFSPLTKRDRVVATGAHICFVGHVTSDELHRHLHSVEVSNGFANRIMWACIKRSKVIAIPRSMKSNEMQVFVDKFLEAVVFAVDSQPLVLSSEAEFLWVEVYPKLTEERLGKSSHIASRAEAQVLRIATIFALLDCSFEVETQHLQAALSVWDFIDASICYLFDEESSDATKVLFALKENSGQMSQTDISTKVFLGNRNSQELSMIRDELSSSNKICYKKLDNSSGTGRKIGYWCLI